MPENSLLFMIAMIWKSWLTKNLTTRPTGRNFCEDGMGTIKLITKETLKYWGACESGYKTFCRLLPDGATLKDASESLIRNGNCDYANWLWEKAKSDDEYTSQTIVTAGDRGTATAGDSGTATAGDRGTATAGDSGRATGGERV